MGPMMDENEMNRIFVKHIGKAFDDMLKHNLTVPWVGENTEVRLANILTNVMWLMIETQREKDEAGE